MIHKKELCHLRFLFVLPVSVPYSSISDRLFCEKVVIVMAKLTAKQRRFCDEYLIDLNATQAAIRAGYSEKNARNIASENLAKPNIKAYIDERMAEKESQLIATQDEVLKYLTSVLRGESQSTEIVVEGTGDGCSEARTLKKEPSEKDRLRAAELLGKRYGLYTDKVETDVDMTLTVNIDYGDEE
nr:MAG TPA: Terminase small subunit [Caudoviricetes sp.]DAY56222.1 MAG TPA: Terminase small subunit [Caudoviricetes sp.]